MTLSSAVLLGAHTQIFISTPSLSDEIVVFEQLGEDAIARIARLMLGEVKERVAAMKIDLAFDDSVVAKLSKEGFDPIYGARPLKRYLQKHVETLSAKLILADEVGEGDTIFVDTQDDKLVASVK